MLLECPAQLTHHAAEHGHLIAADQGPLQQRPHFGHAGMGGVLQQEPRLQEQAAGRFKAILQLLRCGRIRPMFVGTRGTMSGGLADGLVPKREEEARFEEA